MTPSPAYRTCLEALERVLSPRVASRSLHAGMRDAGLTPQDATADGLEPVLKDAVFKQLQVAMPPDEARQYVLDMLAAMNEAEAPPAPPSGAASEDGAAHDAGPDGSSSAAPPPGAPASGPAPAGPTDGDGAHAADAPVPGEVAIEPETYERLRDAARPFNLYFEWPEVRRLRALLARIEDVVHGEDDGGASTLVEEAERSLDSVRQTLEDRLVLQAQELARLEEAYSEVAELGGSKARRLENIVKRVREAQEDRQLADAEVERGSALARDLRKLVASSVYHDADSEGGPDLEARIKALDVDAELAELDRLARDRTLLLEHREDLAARLDEAREQVAAGLTLGDDLASLRERLEQERVRQVDAIGRELTELGRRLDAAETAWTPELRREDAVLHDIVGDGALPPLADLIRFRENAELSLERLRAAGERAEAETVETRARLDLQGDHLQRAQQELLRYGDVAGDPAIERLRDAVAALRSAQAEERVDPEAGEAVRAASDALARDRRDDADPAAVARAQLRALVDQLDGLPAAIDPDGTAELRADLEGRMDAPPDEGQLATLAAAVSDAVAAARDAARRTLDRLSSAAGRWRLPKLLDAVRDANERLEDGDAPPLGDLERRLTASIEETRAAQLARLHALERDAERLSDIDRTVEDALQVALADARERTAAGEPATTLDDAEATVAELERILGRRLGDVLPRLDDALSTIATVERLNSDDVATARRILSHLDDQRDAFGRVSPTLQARMERSLQEAEDLLARLVEEERATRAIADQLMSGSAFDDLLAGFGAALGGDALGGDALGGDSLGNDALGGDGSGGNAPHDLDEPAGGVAWPTRLADRRDVAAAGLIAGSAPHRRVASAVPDDAEATWADAAADVVARCSDLGRALALGAPRVITFEHDDGCVLLGHDPVGTALLVGREPGTLGLLVQELREDAWRRAAAALTAHADSGAPDGDGPGGHRANDAG